jgi:bifunctional non-homologous end joining protein LigD
VTAATARAKKAAPAAKPTRPARRSPSREARRAEDVLGGLRVRVTHPDKPYWPDDGYTKLDLLRYYVETFDLFQPYVKDRLLSFRRCPEGCSGTASSRRRSPRACRPTLRRN